MEKNICITESLCSTEEIKQNTVYQLYFNKIKMWYMDIQWKINLCPQKE